MSPGNLLQRSNAIDLEVPQLSQALQQNQVWPLHRLALNNEAFQYCKGKGKACQQLGGEEPQPPESQRKDRQQSLREDEPGLAGKRGPSPTETAPPGGDVSGQETTHPLILMHRLVRKDKTSLNTQETGRPLPQRRVPVAIGRNGARPDVTRAC